MRTTTTIRGSRSGSRSGNRNVGTIDRAVSIAGGTALAVAGISKLRQRKFFPGIAMAAAGSYLYYRGQTGKCALYKAMGFSTTGKAGGVSLDKSVTISKSPHEVYEYWHNFENLPNFMRHLESVTVTGAKSSHWVARGPAGVKVEWDAEILEDNPGRLISWRSSSNADIPNEGTVEFIEAPGGRGTEVRAHMAFHPPAGALGATAMEVMNTINEQQLEEDLKRFKQVVETGVLATSQMNI
jgi:uncharacterized membrane protein